MSRYTTAKEHYERDVRRGYHPVGTSEVDVLTHELGHAVEWRLDLLTEADSYDAVGLWKEHTIAKEIVKAAVKKYKKETGDKANTARLISRISYYSNEGNHEAFAEAFADYYANGAAANPLSVEIVRLAKEKLTRLRR